MTGKSTETPASRPIAATMMVPATVGRARRASVASPLAAVTIPPIHARNVPNIHQTGRYHHVLPPPIASQVQGYALKGRNRAISMALNTMVLTSPTAAAPAMPSVLRATVHWAGRNATATPAASTMSAVTPPRRPAAIGTSRDAARNATTATAVATPSLAPPTVTVRKSERSEAAGAAVADMGRLSSSMRVGRGDPPRKSKRGLSSGKHQQNHEIGNGPRGERPVHPSLVAGRKERLATPVPRQEHRQPCAERHEEQPPLDSQHGRRPPEQRERQRGTPDRDAEARAHAQEQGEGPVAPAAIFLHLIQLSERIEPGEQWAEAEQDEGVARVERAARGGPAGKRRERPEAPHVDHPVDARHCLEPERRHRVKNRQHETDGVRDAERGWQREADQLAAGEQRHAEREQVARQRGRRIEVADVPLILVEHGIDRERAAVQENHPHRERQERRQQPLPAPRSPETHGQHVAEQCVPRHDRPLGGAQVEHVGEDIARQQPIAPAAPSVQRAGVDYHFRPNAVAAMRSPVRVRSGCTDSISRTRGATKLARPPVAMTCGVWPLGHSALMRRTIPSTASAVPSNTPERIASSVRRPMVRTGGIRSVAGSLAVPRIRASDAVRIPGMITPPRKWPSAVMQSNVVAVPKSTTMVSRRNSCAAASVLRMRSAPTCSGSSTSSVIGSRERPSTTSGRTVVARSTASHSPWVTGGTTDATTAARTSWVDRPSCARYDVRVAAHSSGVREGVVVSRQWASRLSPRNSPTFVSVLLMLMASSMAPLR